MRTASSSSCPSSFGSSCFGSSSFGLASPGLAIASSWRFQPPPEAWRVRLLPSLRPHPACGRRAAPVPRLLSAFSRPPPTPGSPRVASVPGAKWL
ncbi:hypothetical protein PR001_g31114 [Phytophthora rubi]|uniref:Uncharacterized protein n=1 Tax=Phytophthora rubi TaxID=129364 RepID=A0A6A3GMN7_9STRA|nr:hypothetical protein PR001_g31114 [Phytophthora rubi]